MSNCCVKTLDPGPSHRSVRVFRPGPPHRAWASGHCGELVQGPVLDPEDRIQVGLVSLRTGLYRAWAAFRPDGSGRLKVFPAHKTKALAAASLLLEHLRVRLSGTLVLSNPAPEGIGFGTSTMDVTAAMLCVRNVVGVPVDPATLGRLAVAAEAASDPLMLPEHGAAFLWGSRCGRLLERFSGPVPPALVVAVDASLACGAVDTRLLSRRQRFTGTDVDDFRLVLARLRYAIAHQDLAAAGQAATLSAVLNQKQVAQPRFETYLRQGEAAGAAGLAVAHSGCLVAFLFAPEDPGLEPKVDELTRRLGGLGHAQIHVFPSPSPAQEPLHEGPRRHVLPCGPCAVAPAPR